MTSSSTASLHAGQPVLQAGAPLADISRAIYRTKPTPQLRLFGLVLSRLEAERDGRLVWST